MPFDAQQLHFETHAHQYQKSACAHLWNSSNYGGVATLWLDPGYGKTMIVLHAFKALYDAGLVKNMLVIAPLRVAQTVWAQEIEEWASLKGLVACRLHGPKKEKWLKRRDVNIWIINYEGIPWATKLAKKGNFPQCDVVCFDEVRRMKNAQGKRFKAARPLVELAKYKWGLTGTPVSNGLMDLFGQFLILDGGLALGKYITKYRQLYFEQGYDGFSWIPRPGAKEAIEKRIAQYIYRADAFLDLPAEIHDTRTVVLPAAAKKKYKELKQHMIAEMESEGQLIAANAAVLVGKLKQMANGRVYDDQKNVIEIHEAKKEALAELMEELGDEQLLIAYEYNHDLAQLREFFGDDLPYLGAGVNERTALSHVERWNAGEIRVLAAHPASAGHGLNLQKSGAHHILWFGPTVDLDHYIQFIRRLLRQGSKAAHVVVHTFVAEGTVDESVIVSRLEKDGLQSSVLRALTVEFGDFTVTGEETLTYEDTVDMTDLQFKPDVQQGANPFAPQPQTPQPAQQAPQTQPAPQGTPQQPTANPFAAQPTQAPGPAPQPQQPSAPAPTGNPFAQNPAEQSQQIEQAVAAPSVPQPDQGNAPANPFAAQQTAPAPEPQGQAPVQPVAQPQEAVPQPAQNTPAPAPVEQAPVAETSDTGPETGAPTEAMLGQLTQVVPIHCMVPVEKLDKVMAAIGRALK